MNRFWHLPLAVALTGCAQVLGLGEYREGPAGGGANGGGGGGGPKPCSTDAQCSNAKFCDGAEHCGDDGFCAPGTPPCPSPADSVHCATACTESQNAAVCGAAVAKDADGDKHGDPLCQTAPGDDCDEANAARFPGNPEVCDGIDNDCNSMVDEGLPATGGSKEIGGSDGYASAHFAFSPGLGVYGTAYVLSVQVPEVSLVFNGHDGMPSGSLSLGAFNGQFSSVHPRVAASDSEFAVAWNDDGANSSAVYVTLATPTGVINKVLVDSAFNPGVSVDVADASNGDFIVVWTNAINAPNNWIQAQRIRPDGTLMGAPVTISQGSPVADPRVARAGGKYAVVWRTLGPSPVIEGRVFDETFTLGPILTLGDAGAQSSPAITQAGAGFALTWQAPALALGVERLDQSLAVQALNTSMTGISGTLDIASSGSEILVLESDADTTPERVARIHRFGADAILLGGPLQISESNLIDSQTGLATIRVTPLGVAVVWGNVTTQIDTIERVMFRGMGPLLCN